MQEQVVKLLKRLEKVEEQLGQADVLSNQKLYKELAQEHSYLLEVQECYNLYHSSQKQLQESQLLLKSETDPEFIEVIRSEIEALEKQIPLNYNRLETLLIPPDPRDSRTVIIEIRAGTGGDEAAIFVGDCVRM